MKDALGNDLKVGDLVALHVEKPLIWGEVESIAEGGIIMGVNGKGQPQVRLGEVRIKSMHTIAVHPQQPIIGAVLALRDNRPPLEQLPQGSEAASGEPPTLN